MTNYTSHRTLFLLLLLLAAACGSDDNDMFTMTEEEEEVVEVLTFNNTYTVSGYLSEATGVDVDPESGTIYVSGLRCREQERAEAEIVLGAFDNTGQQIVGAYYSTDAQLGSVPDIKAGTDGNFYLVFNEIVSQLTVLGGVSYRWTLTKFGGGDLQPIWSDTNHPVETCQPGFGWDSYSASKLSIYNDGNSLEDQVFVGGEKMTNCTHYGMVTAYGGNGNRLFRGVEMPGLFSLGEIVMDGPLALYSGVDCNFCGFGDDWNVNIIPVESSGIISSGIQLTNHGKFGQAVRTSERFRPLIVSLDRSAPTRQERVTSRYALNTSGGFSAGRTHSELEGITRFVRPLPGEENYILFGDNNNFPWMALYRNNELVWQRTYDQADVTITDVSAHPGGGYVVVGTIQEQSNSVGIWIMKVNDNGLV